MTAWRLEYWLGKERILELYLNVVELGPEVWGVEAARAEVLRPFGATADPSRRRRRWPARCRFRCKSNPGYRPGRMTWRQDDDRAAGAGEKVEIPRTAEEVGIRCRPDTSESRGPPPSGL